MLICARVYIPFSWGFGGMLVNYLIYMGVRPVMKFLEKKISYSGVGFGFPDKPDFFYIWQEDSEELWKVETFDGSSEKVNLGTTAILWFFKALMKYRKVSTKGTYLDEETGEERFIQGYDVYPANKSSDSLNKLREKINIKNDNDEKLFVVKKCGYYFVKESVEFEVIEFYVEGEQVRVVGEPNEKPKWHFKNIINNVMGLFRIAYDKEAQRHNVTWLDNYYKKCSDRSEGIEYNDGESDDVIKMSGTGSNTEQGENVLEEGVIGGKSDTPFVSHVENPSLSQGDNNKNEILIPLTEYKRLTESKIPIEDDIYIKFVQKFEREKAEEIEVLRKKVRADTIVELGDRNADTCTEPSQGETIPKEKVVGGKLETPMVSHTDVLPSIQGNKNNDEIRVSLSEYKRLTESRLDLEEGIRERLVQKFEREKTKEVEQIKSEIRRETELTAVFIVWPFSVLTSYLWFPLWKRLVEWLF